MKDVPPVLGTLVALLCRLWLPQGRWTCSRCSAVGDCRPVEGAAPLRAGMGATAGAVGGLTIRLGLKRNRKG